MVTFSLLSFLSLILFLFGLLIFLFCYLINSADWNLINTHSSNEVPKVADFLGVSKSENQSELAAINEIQSNDSDYLFTNNSLVPLQNPVVDTPSNEYQENANSNLQSLTLSMGSGKDSTCETSGENSTNTVEAAPRRTLDTFGQRTSIYRGVTRLDSHSVLY